MNEIGQAERVQRLSPAKRALLLNAAREKIMRAQRAHAITPRVQNGPANLSYAQQGIWFFEQLEPGSSVFNTPVTVRFVGELNLTALQDSLREIVRRHEILRTILVVVDNRPMQTLLPDFNMDLRLIDLDQREDVATRLINQEVSRPFNLSQDQLLRVTMLRLDSEQYILTLTLHHLVGDAWSRGILLEELKALYKSFSSGMPSPLSVLPIQYADYAEWQRAWLTGEVLDQQLGYWKQQLDAAPERIDLPADRPRPPVQTYRGAKESFKLSRNQLESLKSLSQREGVTLFMTLLAAFKTLLYRYTGQEDISIGMPAANRSRIEVESLIGIFANVLVLRTDLSGNPTFRELLLRVRRVALEAYTHQDFPFEKLVEELRPERTLSHHPLCQVMFDFENAPMEALELPGVVMSGIQSQSHTVPFELLIILTETRAGLAGTVEYNSDLFEAATIKRLARHYERVLSEVVQDVGQELWQIPMLSEAEKEQMLTWNETAVVYPREQTLHDLFTEQAASRAAAVAVEYEGRQLSYGELNRRANQLAHYLRRLGVGAEVRVGLCMERSLELVVGLLGILKAGGAYVPLDHEYPMERLRFMIADAQLKLVLTNEQPYVSFADGMDVRLVDLTSEAAQIGAESDEELESGVTADNLAYVIYTSGSTGTPKGTLTTHRNVTRLFDATRQWFEFGSEDVWTLFHSHAFDFSVWEIWGALLHGGRLVVVPYLVSRTPEAFWQLVCEQDVTVLNQTPSAFRQLIPVARYGNGSGGAARLRQVIFGGEALEVKSLGPWWEHYPREPQLINMYGITETTVHVTYRQLGTEDIGTNGSPIGKAIGDLEMYILDERLQLVPVGVSGELFVGGEGLARGYLNRPELSAERFVPHPFVRRTGARLYRTGDVGRYLPSGEIEFVGRRDAQVKVRGYRIELGEIESVLTQHDGVREAVVVLRADDANNQLVGYVVGEWEGGTLELRRYLKEKLPAYMVPAVLVRMERLPLTAHGKLDRRALPQPEVSRSQSDKPFVPPRTPVEQQLAGLWTELLGVEQVSIYDSFFDLGGHSLLLTQLASRIRNALYVAVPLRRLFEAPTILEMAKVVGECQVQQHDPADLAQMIQELSALTSDEIKGMLAAELVH